MTPEKAVRAKHGADFMGHETSNRPWNSHECTIKKPMKMPKVALAQK